MSSWKKSVPSKSDGDFPERYVPEEGSHPAVLVGLIDLGTHAESFNGGDPKDTHKVLLVWELAGLKLPGTSQPVTIGRDYTYSLSEKSHLRKMIDGWRGKPLGEGEEFDISTLLGKPCLVNVAVKQAKESGSSYGVVASIAGWRGPMVKDRPAPSASIKAVSWTFEDGQLPELAWLPFFCAMGQVKEVIAGAKENRRGAAKAHSEPEPEDSEEPAGVGSEDDSAPF